MAESTCISTSDHEDCFLAFMDLRRRRSREEVDSELPSQTVEVWPCIREWVARYDTRRGRSYRCGRPHWAPEAGQERVMDNETLNFFCERVACQADQAYELRNLYKAVFSIDNVVDARRFFEGYVAYITGRMERGDWNSQNITDPVDAARGNIGWMCGDGMTRAQVSIWQKVGAEHPLLGSL